MQSKRGGPSFNNEVEISFFGPGYGESTVLYLGQNEWIIVDSCINPESKRPASLEYLREIGVEPSKSVIMVIATHWHDDHIAGLSKVVEECKSADFVCSIAQKAEDFLALIYTYDEARMMRRTGVKEFRKILDLLQDGSRRVIWASEMRRIYHRQSENENEIKIWTLSPSDEAITMCKQMIAQKTPHAGETQKAALPSDPNYLATVLYIEIGETKILLGADLIETTRKKSGWSRIIQLKNEQNLGKATVFKIPHHGSKTADLPDIWTTLLKNDPASVVSPFLLARTVLPTRDDMKRICDHTKNGYITAPPLLSRPKRRDKAVERTIREHNIKTRSITASIGQVRMRWLKNQLQSAPHIELYSPATEIKSLIN